MVERVIFAKGRKQGITYKLYKDEIIKRVKLWSDLRKLVEEMRISTEVHGYEYYSDGYSAASGDWADRIEQLLDGSE